MPIDPLKFASTRVGLAISIEVGDCYRDGPIPAGGVGRHRLKGSIAIAEQHSGRPFSVSVVPAFVGDQHIELSIAFQVGYHDLGPKPLRSSRVVGLHCLKSSVTIPQQYTDDPVPGAGANTAVRSGGLAIGDDQVRLTVTVQIGDREPAGEISSGCVGYCRLESPVAVSEQHAHRAL